MVHDDAADARWALGAACFVFEIAMEEGVDFMSESCSGLEKTSPADFDRLDMPYLELADSRKFLDRSICSKGNLSLVLLRDGTPDQVAAVTRNLVAAVHGYAHIYSTADAVLIGTPPENFLAFLRTASGASGTI